MALQNPPSQSPSLLSPPSKVSTETVGKAVDALLKWIKSKAKHQKSQLFEHDEFLYLILTLKKIPPKGRTNPYKIPLPNPLHPFDSSEELCLIIDDRSKSSLTSESAKKKIQSENIPISKVLKLSKLKSDYRAFEAKRKLCSSYDLFFADKRIIPLLPRLLGKEFFKKKKIPIPVELSRKNWKEQIELACHSALLFLRTGTCSVLKVGRVSQSRDEIIANVVAGIDGVAATVPKKWGNIRSFHLKLTESLALPIYQTVPEVGLKIDGGKKDEEERKVESQAESGEESVGEGKEKKSGKKKKKKGRIHEVRYLDNDVDGMLDDIFSDDDDDESNVNTALDSAELTGKKRKKGEKSKMELKKSPKVKKGEGAKKKKSLVKGKGGDQEDDDNTVGDMPVTNGVKKLAKLKKDETVKKKKNVVSLNGKGRGQEDDEEVLVDTPVSSDLKKKKKSKVGKTNSEGIKLKSKKSKQI